MYTMKDFIDGKIAVTFKNRKERLKFLKICEKEGLRWLSDDPATGFDPGNGVAISFGSCGSDNLTYSYPAQNDSKTIPFSEIDRSETIGVIKRNGDTITVHMGDLHGTAKCSPDDQFDLYTGCELALRRALGAEKKESETAVYPCKFEIGKRYKVSIKAATDNKVSCFYRKKNVPKWILEHDGEEVSVNGARTATADGLLFSVDWCEEIKEPEKPAEPEKPKYYNGKMVCVERCVYNWWTR